MADFISEITPSPALIVRADTTVGDCVRQMRDHQVGSMLVMGNQENEHNEIIGIFTERDLLRHIDLIQKGGYWEFPIRTVMSRPVIKIDVSEMPKAGDLMIARNIRHLPIVQKDDEGNEQLLGVISMRDLFRQVVEAKVRPAEKEGLTIAMLSDNPKELQTYGKGMFSLLKADLKQVSPADFAEGKPDPVISQGGLDCLFIDLDKKKPEIWLQILRRVNAAEGLPLLIALYDPLSHPPQEVSVLRKLKGAEKFAVFAKPVNLIELMRRMRRHRG